MILNQILYGYFKVNRQFAYARSWFKSSAPCNGSGLLNCLNVSAQWTCSKITKESVHRNHEKKKISFSIMKSTSAYIFMEFVPWYLSTYVGLFEYFRSAVAHCIRIGSKVRKKFKDVKGNGQIEELDNETEYIQSPYLWLTCLQSRVVFFHFICFNHLCSSVLHLPKEKCNVFLNWNWTSWCTVHVIFCSHFAAVKNM
jgi:hypothetical protein